MTSNTKAPPPDREDITMIRVCSTLSADVSAVPFWTDGSVVVVGLEVMAIVCDGSIVGVTLLSTVL